MNTKLEIYDNANGILIARVEVMAGNTAPEFVAKMANSAVTVKNVTTQGQKSSAPASPTPDPEPEGDDTEFGDMSLSQLKAYAADMGLKTYGTKDQLIARIEDAGYE